MKSKMKLFLFIITINALSGLILCYKTPEIYNYNEDDIDNYIDKYYINGQCQLPDNLISEIRGYQSIVNKIIKETLDGKFKGGTWKDLAEMTDKWGNRLTGSQNLEDAIDWMVEKLKSADLDNVHTENATVAHWVRGYEAATLLSPRNTNLRILGLGTSVGTIRGGIIGDVIAVESFDEFDKLQENEVKGKIVVFVPPWVSYGETVKYRAYSASVASKKGAIAALIRSVTPKSMNSPHTGMQDYQDGVRKIPAASLTVEDAEMLLRMYRRGDKIQIHLEMDDRNLAPTISRNTIAELQGRVNNSSVVVVSGHFDSWDVGVGAMDDGGGAFISWKAVEYLKKMKLQPRRTIRSILWTGEEFGYLGAIEYRKNHLVTAKSEFNFFMESDIGTFDPLGIDFTGNKDSGCIVQEILKLMNNLNATHYTEPSDGGPDISIWIDDGFPVASLINKNEEYFWYHHSEGDSMLVENPSSLDKCTALWAAVAYVIADLSIEMPKNLKLDNFDMV